MVEAIPKWSAEDERRLQELTDRKAQRAHQLTNRVIDVADEIHIHNMSEDEIGDTLYKDGSVSSSTLSSRLLCATDDRQAAAGLSRGKLVNFTAFVADVQRIPVRNPANGVVREFKTLIARCNF